MAKVKPFNPSALEQGREYPAHSGPALLAQFLEVLTSGEVKTPEQAAVMVERTLSYEMSTHTRFVEPDAPRKSLPLPTTDWQGPRANELRDADTVLFLLWSSSERLDSMRYAEAHRELERKGWLKAMGEVDDVEQYHLGDKAHEFMGVLFGVLAACRAYVEAHEDKGFTPSSEHAIREEARVLCGILGKAKQYLRRGIGSVASKLNAHAAQLPIWAQFDGEQYAQRVAQNFGTSVRVQGLAE